MDRAHDLKAALSFHDHPLAKQAVERIAELEAELVTILDPSNRGTSGRLIIDAMHEARIRKLIGR